MKALSKATCAALALAVGMNVMAQEAAAEGEAPAAASSPYGSAVRTEFATVSNVHSRQNETDLTYYDVNSTSPVAIALLPLCEAPGVNSAITGFRLNLGVGEHVDVYGLDIGVIGNNVRREIGGVQIGIIFNTAGESDGALQIAAACNCVDGDFSGAQIGLFNFAEKGCGLQLGLVNKSGSFRGVQIGVLNFNDASSVPMFPVVNVGF